MSQTLVSCLFVYLSRDRRILLRMNSGDVSIKEQDTVLYIPTEGFVKATRSKSERLGTQHELDLTPQPPPVSLETTAAGTANPKNFSV